MTGTAGRDASMHISIAVQNWLLDQLVIRARGEEYEAVPEEEAVSLGFEPEDILLRRRSDRKIFEIEAWADALEVQGIPAEK